MRILSASHLYKLILIVLFGLQGIYSSAQDIQFSQFYAAQTYLSPAFAGSTHQTRGMFHQRLQWPRLQAKYITSMASFDKYYSEYNSGIGAVLLYDQQGSGDISSVQLNLQYAYEIHVNKDITVRPGLELGYGFRNTDYSSLSFPSQFNNDVGQFTTAHDYSGAMLRYWDITAGALVYSKNFWGGYFMNHLNRPNMALIGDEDKLPTRFTVIGGYKIHLRPQSKLTFSDMQHEFSVTPTLHYKAQGKSDQLDFGVYLRYDHLLAGLWYRGIPVKRFDKGLHNNESMVASLGWRYHRWTITYSYDWVVSRLTQAQVGGAHEINLTYVNLKKFKKRKIMKRIPCPDLFGH